MDVVDCFDLNISQFRLLHFCNKTQYPINYLTSIIIFTLLTVVFSLLTLIVKLNPIPAVICFIIEVIMTKYRDKIDYKK